MNKTRVQIAFEKGYQEGLEEGALRMWRAEMIAELLEARFGPIPHGFTDWLAAQVSLNSLKSLLIAAGTAPSFDEFRSRAGW